MKITGTKLEICYPSVGFQAYQEFQYPAGEYQVRLTQEGMEAVQKAEDIVVYATIKDGHFTGLGLLMNAIWECILESENFEELTLALPYLPYARADRKFVKGDSFALQVMGSFLDIIPHNRIVTLDAHSSVSEAYIQGLENIPAFPLIRWASNLIKYTYEESLTLLLPDKGASRYCTPDSTGKLTLFGMPVLQCDKKRDPSTGKLSGFVVPDGITTGAVLIIDDLCDAGGTFIGIADELDEKYPEENLSKYLYVTHGIFSKGFDELNKRFKRIYTTSSYVSRDCKEVAVFPVEHLIREHLWGSEYTNQDGHETQESTTNAVLSPNVSSS